MIILNVEFCILNLFVLKSTAVSEDNAGFEELKEIYFEC